MWLQWFPWRFLIKRAARARGFVDPIRIMSRLTSFAQPSEVLVPVELLRAGAVLHARGLINSQAIQHNLDWVWPCWVNRQFDPAREAFIPRAFSLTQINLTGRNWTAVGLPDGEAMAVVDPHGLVMPFFDSWSLDAWLIADNGTALVPARLETAAQHLDTGDTLAVLSVAQKNGLTLKSHVEITAGAAGPRCRIRYLGRAPGAAWLAVSVRPCNPEGISFVHSIALLPDTRGWRVNDEQLVHFSRPPDRLLFSQYHRGDVFLRIRSAPDPHQRETTCHVGMATAAALFRIAPGHATTLSVDVPLERKPSDHRPHAPESTGHWRDALRGSCSLTIPDRQIRCTFEAARSALVLHTPGCVYAGPFTYRRFWIRDAAFITYALLCSNMTRRAEKAIACMLATQDSSGYFVSQKGEWDSNGQVLWVLAQYCDLTGAAPPGTWLPQIRRAAAWIRRKRASARGHGPCAGLMPPGFSAEHLGPSDYYYWDDFWSIAGLEAADRLLRALGDTNAAAAAGAEAASLRRAVTASIATTAAGLHTAAIPASPNRRLDSGAVGSLALSYPLQLCRASDPRIMATADFLYRACLVTGGFFHTIIHSGINPYLTLHLAQVLLRAGDARWQELLQTIAGLASPTGQWPEAIHPRLGTGCMGDGQHCWAAAEWLLMIRNCFLREEAAENRLMVCPGIVRQWYESGATLHFGPAPTRFGTCDVRLVSDGTTLSLSFEIDPRGPAPDVTLALPGHSPCRMRPGQRFLSLPLHQEEP